MNSVTMMEASSSEEIASVPALPDETMLEIFKKATLIGLLHCERCSRRFRTIIQENLPKLKKRCHFVISSDNFNVSFNAHEDAFDPQGRAIQIRSAETTQEVTDREDFLRTLEDGEASVIFTMRTKEAILDAVYKRLARHCEVTRIEASEYDQTNNEPDPIYIGPLHYFEDLEQMTVRTNSLHQRNLDELQEMTKLKSLQMCHEPKGDRDWETEEEHQKRGLDFDLRKFHYLQDLRIVAAQSECPIAIDDSMLLEARGLVVLVLTNMQTEVSIRGLGALLDEWLEGRREIDTICLRGGWRTDDYFLFGDAFPTDLLHLPSDSRVRDSHSLTRPSDGAQIEVTLMECHIRLQNPNSNYEHFTSDDFDEDNYE